MRWVGRTGAAVIVAALVVLAPALAAPASAIGWKNPVDPYPDLPSQQWKTWQAYKNASEVYGYEPGSIGWQEEQAALRALLESEGYPAPSDVSRAKATTVKTEKLIITGEAKPGKAVDISSLPKPVTRMGPVARGAAGANLLGTAFVGGFAVGAGGIQLVGALTGTDYDGAMCGTEQWVQTAYGLLSMGLGPSCVAAVVEPNGDVSGETLLSFGDSRLSLLGYVTYPTGQLVRYACYSGVWSPLPAGYQLFGHSAPDKWALTSGTPATKATSSLCVEKFSGTAYVGLAGQASTGYGTGFYQIRDSTGAVVAETAPVAVDPIRDATCDLTWPDGSSTSGVVGRYRESEGFPIGGVDAGCTSAFNAKQGSGGTVYPSGISLGSSNSETGLRTPLLEQTVPEYDEEELAALEDTTGKGLELFRGTESCLTWAADCSGWWEETDKGQDETEYRCTFGGVKVALAQCYVYSATFEDQTGTGAENPTITDPVTGQPVEWSGNEAQNSTDPALGPTPGETCMGQWSAVANPIEWVFHPVQCALLWAFAPREAKVQTVFTEAMGKWNETMPGQIAIIAADTFSVPDISGCEGVSIDMPFSTVGVDGWVDVHWTVLNSCEEPAASVAMWARWIGAAVLVFLTALGIIRRASATVNAPGLGGGGS